MITLYQKVLQFEEDVTPCITFEKGHRQLSFINLGHNYLLPDECFLMNKKEHHCSP